MQDIIVYTIILTAISFTLIATIKKIKKIAKAESNQGSICNGCSGCSLSNNGASCSTPIKQIQKFE